MFEQFLFPPSFAQETEACNDERRRKEDAEYSTLELQDKDHNVQHLQKVRLVMQQGCKELKC